MSWQERYSETGKFRNAKFYAESSSVSGGRRNQVHEFPLQDKPFVEDLGRKAKTFNPTLYVIGPDYMDDRDALIEALDGFGPGTLIHPWYGSMRVSVLDYQVSESTARGGMATFNVTFSESGTEAKPSTSVDTVNAVSLTAEQAMAQAETDFLKDFSLDNLPDFSISQLTDYATNLVPELQTALDAVQTVQDLKSTALSKISSFKQTISSLIRLPAKFAAEFIGFTGSFTALLSNPFDALSVYKSIFKLGSESHSPVLYSQVSSKAVAPRQAIARLVAETAVINAALASTVVEYESRDQALSVRDELIELIDEIVLTASDEQYQLLSDLQALVNQDLSIRGAQLPELRTHRSATVLPSLVLAHRIYYNNDLEADIISRNAIAHPGFVQATELEVLNG